ncbi:MarR family winged helix-turn-helix transcriptional regulator [Angustibacter sp. McL0619]|uniref:MarR family winged helix-turn-helix transcriptional regulator n=1 Tax=Angustibacter sp. McL0619 TaxID=3415676 RepID=UPI003CFACC07
MSGVAMEATMDVKVPPNLAASGPISPAAASTADDEVRRIQLELGVLVSHARTAMRDAATYVHPELQSSGYAILFHLVQQGPTLARGLVEVFGLDKAAVSRQVGQLEQLGLIARRPHPDDRRAQLLTATPGGEARCRADIDRRSARLRELLAGWTAADLDSLASLLGRLNRSVTLR